MAQAMAGFAAAREGGGTRQAAMTRLREAMMKHPELVSGKGRTTNSLVPAMQNHVALKSGAEGFFVAMVPALNIGVALKIEDGAGRGAEAAIAAILSRLGVLDPAHPAARAVTHGPITNKLGIETGHYRVTEAISGLRL
jgi:L-asparaginase II